MGRELQRAFLWMIFLLALFMLWDAWQVRNGNPSFFGTPAPVQEQVADAETSAGNEVPSAPVAGSKAVASEVNVTINKPVVVTTDLFKVTFDANGASVARAELLEERQTPDWKTRGLPGLIFGSTETEQQFEDTLSLVRQVKFASIFAFMYSPREGTVAAKMDGQIDEKIKHERVNRLLNLEKQIQKEAKNG